VNLDTLITDLQTYIDRNQLVKAKVADAIGVKPSGLSHILSGNENPTGQQVLAIIHLTSTIQTDSGLKATNAAVLKRFAKNSTSTYIQSNKRKS